MLLRAIAAEEFRHWLRVAIFILKKRRPEIVHWMILRQIEADADAEAEASI